MQFHVTKLETWLYS